MGPDMTELSQAFEQFKAAFERKDFETCTELLSQLKVLMKTFKSLPPILEKTPNATHELTLARDIYEHAVILSVNIKDQDAFQKDFSELKPYYTDARERLPPSPQEYAIIGLNLLRLLVLNRIAEFHTELDRLPPNALDDHCIKYVVQLRQFFAEGAYKRVESAKDTVPHASYVYFVHLLAKTISAESMNEGSSGGNDARLQNVERELKRPRRKQPNRGSVLRFRLQIEAECAEPAALVLTSSDSPCTLEKMSDNDEKAGSVDVIWPEEKAFRLKVLAEQKYTSRDLQSALKYAKRANKLHPSLKGLQELLTSLKILHTATIPIFESSSSTQNSAPDYYKILQVERFSHVNTIKKQYKKLALILHPDKNSCEASEEAFKLVGEAAGVLLDKVKRKAYDVRLRIVMHSEATEGIELVTESVTETFWTECSTCQLLHQFERRYLGHNLMCPRCKKSFKATEVEEDRNDVGTVDNEEKNEGVGVGQKRVSARIKEKVAKGENLGVVERFGLGVKRKTSSVDNVLKRSEVKLARNMDEDGILLKDLKPKSAKKAVKLGDHDGDPIEGFRSGEARNLDGNGNPGSRDIDVVNESRSRRVEVKVGIEDAVNSGEVEIVESERTKRAMASEEETMTLSQMQMLVKKPKRAEGKLTTKKDANTDKLNLKENGGDNKKEKGREKESEEDDGVGKGDEGKETVNSGVKMYKRRVPKASKSLVHPEIEMDRASEEGNEEVTPVQKEKEMQDTREKRQRRRASKYADMEFVKTRTPRKYVESQINELITTRKDNIEIMPVEDSDFHDFDKDRKEKSFKKGQVWAVYDDNDGMPRQYAVMENISSINPFEVTLSWLQYQSNGDDELTRWQQKGFHISCGNFKVSSEVSINYLNLFSHVVKCERAARETYRIYPMKGSVWALHHYNHDVDVEERSRSYDIVVCLSSYNDIYGLSVGNLEKVDGFRTVFKRREIGGNGVKCLRKNDLKLFSHQIPAKKLSGEEACGLPKDCWELDPASVTPHMLLA